MRPSTAPSHPELRASGVASLLQTGLLHVPLSHRDPRLGLVESVDNSTDMGRERNQEADAGSSMHGLISARYGASHAKQLRKQGNSWMGDHDEGADDDEEEDHDDERHPHTDDDEHDEHDEDEERDEFDNDGAEDKLYDRFHDGHHDDDSEEHRDDGEEHDTTENSTDTDTETDTSDVEDDGSQRRRRRRDAVRVAVRCRPMLPVEHLTSATPISAASRIAASAAATAAAVSAGRICVQIQGNSVLLGRSRLFHFDAAFGPLASQEDIYRAVARPIVKQVLKGFNGTIMAYGQTGAGKTHTMGSGGGMAGGLLPSRSRSNAAASDGASAMSQTEEALAKAEMGIIPRVVNDLFRRVDKLKARGSKINSVGDGENGGEVDVHVYVSYIEIYQEIIRDLLGSPHATSSAAHVVQASASTGFGGARIVQPQGLPLREDLGGGGGGGGVSIIGAREIEVHSAQELLRVISRGSIARTTGGTNMNAVSSRSHAICIVKLKQSRSKYTTAVPVPATSPPTSSSNPSSRAASASRLRNQQQQQQVQEVVTSKFHLVDLAGSERQRSTGTMIFGATRFKESVTINRGLLALANVIQALAASATSNHSQAFGHLANAPRHIPYRSSKLTRVLQGSLGGNARTFMVACVAPSEEYFDETLNTLKYASRARSIRNKAVVNVDVEVTPTQPPALPEPEPEPGPIESMATSTTDQAEVSRMAEEIRRLRSQLGHDRSTIMRSPSHFGDMSASAGESDEHGGDSDEDIQSLAHLASSSLDRHSHLLTRYSSLHSFTLHLDTRFDWVSAGVEFLVNSVGEWFELERKRETVKERVISLRKEYDRLLAEQQQLQQQSQNDNKDHDPEIDSKLKQLKELIATLASDIKSSQKSYITYRELLEGLRMDLCNSLEIYSKTKIQEINEEKKEWKEKIFGKTDQVDDEDEADEGESKAMEDKVEQEEKEWNEQHHHTLAELSHRIRGRRSLVRREDASSTDLPAAASSKSSSSLSPDVSNQLQQQLSSLSHAFETLQQEHASLHHSYTALQSTHEALLASHAQLQEQHKVAMEDLKYDDEIFEEKVRQVKALQQSLTETREQLKRTSDTNEQLTNMMKEMQQEMTKRITGGGGGGGSVGSVGGTPLTSRQPATARDEGGLTSRSVHTPATSTPGENQTARALPTAAAMSAALFSPRSPFHRGSGHSIGGLPFATPNDTRNPFRSTTDHLALQHEEEDRMLTATDYDASAMISAPNTPAHVSQTRSPRPTSSAGSARHASVHEQQQQLRQREQQLRQLLQQHRQSHAELSTLFSALQSSTGNNVDGDLRLRDLREQLHDVRTELDLKRTTLSDLRHALSQLHATAAATAARSRSRSHALRRSDPQPHAHVRASRVDAHAMERLREAEQKYMDLEGEIELKRKLLQALSPPPPPSTSTGSSSSNRGSASLMQSSLMEEIAQLEQQLQSQAEQLEQMQLSAGATGSGAHPEHDGSGSGDDDEDVDHAEQIAAEKEKQLQQVELELERLQAQESKLIRTIDSMTNSSSRARQPHDSDTETQQNVRQRMHKVEEEMHRCEEELALVQRKLREIESGATAAVPAIHFPSSLTTTITSSTQFHSPTLKRKAAWFEHQLSSYLQERSNWAAFQVEARTLEHLIQEQQQTERKKNRMIERSIRSSGMGSLLKMATGTSGTRGPNSNSSARDHALRQSLQHVEKQLGDVSHRSSTLMRQSQSIVKASSSRARGGASTDTGEDDDASMNAFESLQNELDDLADKQSRLEHARQQLLEQLHQQNAGSHTTTERDESKTAEVIDAAILASVLSPDEQRKLDAYNEKLDDLKLELEYKSQRLKELQDAAGQQAPSSARPSTSLASVSGSAVDDPESHRREALVSKLSSMFDLSDPSEVSFLATHLINRRLDALDALEKQSKSKQLLEVQLEEKDKRLMEVEAALEMLMSESAHNEERIQQQNVRKEMEGKIRKIIIQEERMKTTSTKDPSPSRPSTTARANTSSKFSGSQINTNTSPSPSTMIMSSNRSPELFKKTHRSEQEISSVPDTNRGGERMPTAPSHRAAGSGSGSSGGVPQPSRVFTPALPSSLHTPLLYNQSPSATPRNINTASSSGSNLASQRHMSESGRLSSGRMSSSDMDESNGSMAAASHSSGHSSSRSHHGSSFSPTKSGRVGTAYPHDDLSPESLRHLSIPRQTNEEEDSGMSSVPPSARSTVTIQPPASAAHTHTPASASSSFVPHSSAAASSSRRDSRDSAFGIGTDNSLMSTGRSLGTSTPTSSAAAFGPTSYDQSATTFSSTQATPEQRARAGLALLKRKQSLRATVGGGSSSSSSSHGEGKQFMQQMKQAVESHQLQEEQQQPPQHSSISAAPRHVAPTHQQLVSRTHSRSSTASSLASDVSLDDGGSGDGVYDAPLQHRAAPSGGPVPSALPRSTHAPQQQRKTMIPQLRLSALTANQHAAPSRAPAQAQTQAQQQKQRQKRQTAPAASRGAHVD